MFVLILNLSYFGVFMVAIFYWLTHKFLLASYSDVTFYWPACSYVTFYWPACSYVTFYWLSGLLTAGRP